MSTCSQAGGGARLEASGIQEQPRSALHHLLAVAVLTFVGLGLGVGRKDGLRVGSLVGLVEGAGLGARVGRVLGAGVGWLQHSDRTTAPGADDG